MRRLILVGLLAAAASPLLAQAAPAPQPMAHAMMMGMAKTMTRAEVQTRIQAQFAKRDANRDGFLTTDELAMRGGGGEHGMMRKHGMMGEHGAMGGAMPGTEALRDPKIAFDRIDINRDGMLSRDEFARGRQVRVERIVINRSGEQGGMAGMAGMGVMRGMKGMNGMRHGGGGMMGAGMFKMADTNRDGKVSIGEATAGALQHFDMMDANRDGRLTSEERKAGRARMMQMRKAG